MSRYLLAAAVALFAAAVASAQPVETGPPTPLVATLLPTIGDEGLQKELKLSADQTKRLLAFRQKRWDAEYTTPAKDLKPADTNKAAEAEFAAVLSPEQLKRAKQIALQFAWNDGGPNWDGLRTGVSATNSRVVPLSVLRDYPAVADALKLDEAQKNAFKAPGGFRYSQVMYLTPPQSAVAKDLLGPPFVPTALVTRQYDPRNSGYWGGPVGGPADLRYTSSPDVQKELKLTADQIAALDELRKKYPTYARGGRGGFIATGDTALSHEARQKAAEKLDAETTAAVEKVLTAEQRARLAQLPRQGLITRSLFLERNALGKELGVTAEQRKAFEAARTAHDAAVAKAVLADEPIDQVKAKVAALDKEAAAAVEAILTPAQQAKRKELTGAEFKGRLTVVGFGGPGGGFGRAGGLPPALAAARERTFGLYSAQLSQLARLPGLQAELKLTQEQVKKVQDANQELLTKVPPRPPVGDEDEAKKLAAQRSAFIEKALSDILDKDQQARLREVFLQQLDVRTTSPFTNSFGAVSYPGVADAIKLTADQKKKLFAGDKSDDVLTEEQKKAVKDMLGKPADVAAVFAVPGGPGRARTTLALPPAYQLLLNSELWDEIKLTPEQVTKLVPALNEYTATSTSGRVGGFDAGGFGGGPPTAPDTTKLQAAVDALTAAADATLTAEQKKRLGQLTLQQRAAASLMVVFGVPEAFRSPVLRYAQVDVQKELGVTTEQMAKINTASADAMERASLLGRGATFVDVSSVTDARTKLRARLDERILKELTPAQVAKWKEMTGEPYKGFTRQPVPAPFRGGPGGGRGGFGGDFAP